MTSRIAEISNEAMSRPVLVPAVVTLFPPVATWLPALAMPLR